MMIASDRLSGSMLGDIVEMTGPRDPQRTNYLRPVRAVDRRWDVRKAASHRAPTRAEEPEARAAADEVERLRTAVRPSMNWRGFAVRFIPSCPLPVNRGTCPASRVLTLNVVFACSRCFRPRLNGGRCVLAEMSGPRVKRHHISETEL